MPLLKTKPWSEYTPEERRFWMVVAAVSFVAIVGFNAWRANGIAASQKEIFRQQMEEMRRQHEQQQQRTSDQQSGNRLHPDFQSSGYSQPTGWQQPGNPPQAGFQSAGYPQQRGLPQTGYPQRPGYQQPGYPQQPGYGTFQGGPQANIVPYAQQQ